MFYYIIYYNISKINAVKICEVLVKKLNFMAGMTRCFISAKTLIRYLRSNTNGTLNAMLNEFAQNRKLSDESLG